MDQRNNQRFNKKRKSFGTYLKWERYQGKRRRFGQGTHIGEDIFNYFIRIMEVKVSDFSTAEDREIFIDNVFEQTAGKEIEISCNQVGSRAIETFLPWANDKILLRFTYAFSKDLMQICCNDFASHVIQQLIIVVSARLQKIQSIDSEKNASQESPSSAPEMCVRFKNWLQQVSKFVVDNLEELMWEKYANHVIRTVLECLSGLPPGSISKEKKWGKEWVPGPEAKTSPIDEGFSLVEECGSHVLQMPQIFDYVDSNLISGLLQTVLTTVCKVDSNLSDKIVCRLLDDCFDPELPDLLPVNTIPKIFMSQAATRLMDVMIGVANKTFTQIFTRCFNNKLQALSLGSDANFCVQNLIKHCKKKEEFESIFEELNPSFDTLLHSNKHGVLLALGQACQRFSCKEDDFIKQLQAAFHCVQPERQVLFPLLVAHLVDYDTWCQLNGNENVNDARKLSITVTGSLLVQTMLSFMKTSKIVRALLEMDCKHLLNLLCHSNGCYVGDAFLDSQTVGEKRRKKFFQKLQGSFVALAVSKCGSRILDKLWLWASLKDKKLILEELASSESLVMSVIWGKLFARKKGLSLFKRRPNDWEESQTRITHAKKLFADIIGT